MLESAEKWASTPCGLLSLQGRSDLHLDDAALSTRLKALGRPNQTGHHSLSGIVLRGASGRRIQPEQATVSIEGGLHGDRWAEGKANPSNQISMMNVHIAHAIANGQSVALFGDNLFTDLDLSEAVLPVGTHLQVGAVLLRVSEEPHVPCGQFRDRFGPSAFVRAAKQPRIRGVYLTVVRGGLMSLGDAVAVHHALRTF